MSIDYIIQGEYLLSMDETLSVWRDGAAAVAGDTIVDVGPFSDLYKKHSSATVIGGKGKLVLPGLVNAHTHAAMTYFRGLADDLPLETWLRDYIWPAEARWLDGELVHDAVELACLEMLKSGVTTYSDMYYFQETAAETAEMIGIRCVLGSGILDFPSVYAKTPEDYLAKAESFIRAWKGSRLVHPCVAPHAPYTCSERSYRLANELSERHGVKIHTHLAETCSEVSRLKMDHAKTPVEYLDSIGVLSQRLLAAHCVWVTESDIELLARRQVGVAHCVKSNMKLGAGFAPVVKMLDAGVSVGLGTDSAASNNDLNILSEMSIAAKVQKAISKDPTVIDNRVALLMATREGAQVLGLQAEIGSIQPSKKADLIVADLQQPHLLPISDIYSLVAHSLRASDIETVMVDGRILVYKGRPTTIDQERVLAKARTWERRIMK